MKRKFDELISYFNRKVSDMSIDQKYKMELLGMISAIGFAHEKELGTNLAEVGKDCISRQQAIDVLENDKAELNRTIRKMSANDVRLDHYVAQYNQVDYDIDAIKQLPPIQLDKDKVSDLLYHIYSIQSPHLDMSGVIAKKYYCEELWKELFGKESELPRWMN